MKVILLQIKGRTMDLFIYRYYTQYQHFLFLYIGRSHVDLPTRRNPQNKLGKCNITFIGFHFAICHLKYFNSSRD